MSAQPTTTGARPALTGAKPSLISLIRRDRAWIIMMILPLLYFALFRYLPLYGMVIAFKDYSVGRGIWGSEWVGLKWFLQFFDSIYFWRLVRNTFLISFYMLLFGFPVPILFALCLNEIRSVGFRRTVQTVSYLPYFISVVVVVGIMVNFVSINGGIINVIIARLGGTPVNFMNEVGWFRPMYVLSEIWQDFGFGSIIYLAAIAGIDEELYDAAEVDGCSRWQRIRYVTLPGISATIIILLILRSGRMFTVGFEKILLMYSGLTYEVADVISTYVYRRGILSGEYSFGAAVGLFDSVINVAFLLLFNHIARKLSDTSLW